MRTAFTLALMLAMTAAPARARGHGGHGHGTHGAERNAAATDAAIPVVAGADAPAAAPTPPTDHAADALYDAALMEKARIALRREAGGMTSDMLMIDRLEWRPGPGRHGYDWELEGWVGGDTDRLAVKSRGEGAFGGRAEAMEVQAGWLHAIDPWFNVRAGLRQDVQPRPNRTHAVLAVEGLAPYWFKVEGELFLSQKGEVTARAQASYDQRITQRLILQPQMEVNLSARDRPDLRSGAGFTALEAGLRLRYEFAREFAPYAGLRWARLLGRTARYARQDGDGAGGLRFVAGLRFWF